MSPVKQQFVMLCNIVAYRIVSRNLLGSFGRLYYKDEITHVAGMEFQSLGLIVVPELGLCCYLLCYLLMTMMLPWPLFTL